LLPAVVVLLACVGFVRGKFSGIVLIAAAFASPMAGLMIGGVLDRVYESAVGRRSA
jgi:hypothetical protein